MLRFNVTHFHWHFPTYTLKWCFPTWLWLIFSDTVLGASGHLGVCVIQVPRVRLTGKAAGGGEGFSRPLECHLSAPDEGISCSAISWTDLAKAPARTDRLKLQPGWAPGGGAHGHREGSALCGGAPPPRQLKTKVHSGDGSSSDITSSFKAVWETLSSSPLQGFLNLSRSGPLSPRGGQSSWPALRKVMGVLWGRALPETTSSLLGTVLRENPGPVGRSLPGGCSSPPCRCETTARPRRWSLLQTHTEAFLFLPGVRTTLTTLTLGCL